MLQSLTNLAQGDSRALQAAVGAIVVLVLLALIYAAYRLIFAHRVRAPGAARGRPPRLGVVDVFSLDGQRQLVIVRRDNTEHLLMIGGPNDFVIESQIVRGGAPVNGREAAKPAIAAAPEPLIEVAATPAAPRPVPPIPAVAVAAPPPRRGFTRPATGEAAAPAVEPASPAAPASAPPVSAPDVAPEPARPAAKAEPKPVIELAPAAPSEPKPAPADIARKPLARPLSVAPRPTLPSPISPLRPRNVPTEPAAVAVEPAKAEARPAAAAPPVIVTPPPVIVTPPPSDDKPRGRKEETFYDLESLEAEMARLLGRDG